MTSASAGEDTPPGGEHPPEPLRIDARRVLVMLVVGVGVALLLLRLVDERQAFRQLASANTGFVVLAITAESLRYLAVALYTQKLVHFLGSHIPLWPMVELMFAGGSANRIVSAGGAAGIYVRYRFFDNYGLSLGSLAVVLILQNLMTGVILFVTFCLGLLYLLNRQLLGPVQLLVAGGTLCAMLSLFGVSVALYRRPALLRRVMDRLARIVYLPISKVARKRSYNPAGLLQSIDRFYQAVEVGRRNPLDTAKAMAYGILTLFSDIACLYFVFRALGFPIRPDVLIVGYVVTNYIISFLLMPEGIGVTELSLTAVYTSLGVPSSTVVVATLLFRLIAFWLPIGTGLLAMWDLRRKSLF